jgi:hypothetical protein
MEAKKLGGIVVFIAIAAGVFWYRSSQSEAVEQSAVAGPQS